MIDSKEGSAPLKHLIDAHGVGFSYAGKRVLKDFSLSILEGERVALVGPNGCGKSTFLAMLGGHVKPTQGELVVRAKARTVHQADGLFPWFNVRENLALSMGAEALEAALSRADRLVDEKISEWGLSDYSELYPRELSESMQQEIELACALSGRAKLLLLDEPFAALDALSRQELQRDLTRTLNQDRARTGIRRTVVLVTHDVFEAVALCDRVLVLSSKPARVIGEVATKDLEIGASIDDELWDRRMERVRDVYRILGREITSPLT